MADPLSTCPDCGAAMSIDGSKAYGTLRRRYRECPSCGRRDRQLIRPAEEITNLIVRSASGTQSPQDATDPR